MDVEQTIQILRLLRERCGVWPSDRRKAINNAIAIIKAAKVVTDSVVEEGPPDETYFYSVGCEAMKRLISLLSPEQAKGLEKIKVHPNEVEQRLREIEERVNKAAPGPWRAVCEATAEETACGRDVYSLIGPEWVEEGDYSFFGEHDAQFIAHAREDIPWLLSLLREKERGAV